jgi:para-aminobenzoate synthetase component 1
MKANPPTTLMTPAVLTRELELDPLAAARALSHRPGTLLLHGQRDWRGSKRSALLFDPRWSLFQTLGAPLAWTGDVPTPVSPPLPAEQLLFHMAASWRPREATHPLFAGIAGYLGYDLGPARWSVVPSSPPPFELPDCRLYAYDCALVFGEGEVPRLVVADLDPWVAAGVSLEERLEEAAAILGESSSPLVPYSHRIDDQTFPDVLWHQRAVTRIQRHLRVGDAYQVNLTGFASARCDLDPFAAFLDQSRRNPVAFAAFLRTEEAAISSHSPELLLRLHGDRAETAPIKGTTAEGPGDAESLAASPKDTAEHIMIVDLCRNDLGISADYGSVEVSALMEPMRLARLVHLVSRIEARIPVERRHRILHDLFPGGSITGAPKRRAMEIIAEVELGRRGPYTGSFGYVDVGGFADWNIAIRTAVWQNGRVAFGCGGGIVLDSVAEQEHEEAVLKARSFFDTLYSLGLAARAHTA